MSKMNHTPTPWTLMAIDDDREWIQGANEDIVCDIHDDHLEESFSCVNPVDAEFIVRAVNSHDELLEAAKAVLVVVSGFKAQRELDGRSFAILGETIAVQKLEQAIQKAEGK